MEIIIYLNEVYHLITVTKDMLTGLEVKKGMDLFEVCNVLRENYMVMVSFLAVPCLK